jgi:hypothetical protein
VARAASFKIAFRAFHVVRNLRFQLFKRTKLALITQAVKKPNPDNIPVKVARPVDYESLD